MPDLLTLLNNQDIGFLRIVAEKWGLDMIEDTKQTLNLTLAKSIIESNLLPEIVSSLPEAAGQAFQFLQSRGGALPWALFTRQFGDIRTMGPAKRDRDRPDLHPDSPSEILWYRALIGRAIIENETIPEECAFIPDDIFALLSPLVESEPAPLGEQAPSKSIRVVAQATDHILDHACTLLAALRCEIPLGEIDSHHWRISPFVLKQLLVCAGILDNSGSLISEEVKKFLEMDRPSAMLFLSRMWMNSPFFNELRFLPGFQFEGEWKNNPLTARQNLLRLIKQIPSGEWWNTSSFVEGVYAQFPDFQRSGGDYDSWYIRREGSQDFLRGFDHWFDIDGELVSYLINKPLHWLGFVDLGSTKMGESPSVFRITPQANLIWNNTPPPTTVTEKTDIHITYDGEIQVHRSTPRWLRYQIARFCDWKEERRDIYLYSLSGESLTRAQKQGLYASQLITLLRKNISGNVHPNVIQLLQNWGNNGPQAEITSLTVIRVKDENILSKLQKSSSASLVVEMIDSKTAVIAKGNEERVLRALASLGYAASIAKKLPGWQ